MVPDQQLINDFYCSSCNMRKQIYNRRLWLFTATYSEAWAEGRASPGRSKCMYTTWGMHRDAHRQNCKQQCWCYTIGLHICRGHAPSFHMVHSLVGIIIALFAAAIAFATTRLQNHLESSKKSEVLKYWAEKKDTTEEPECRVTLAKGYLQALV